MRKTIFLTNCRLKAILETSIILINVVFLQGSKDNLIYFILIISDASNHETRCSLTVGGKTLPKMTNAMQLEVNVSILEFVLLVSPLMYVLHQLNHNVTLFHTVNLSFQVLQSALYTFDVMESIQARIEELMELKMKSGTETKNVNNSAF